MKRAVITTNNLGRLANQLWFSISVYAYSLESKSIYENNTFFEYQKYFDNLSKTNTSLFFESINSIFQQFSRKYGRYGTYLLLSIYTKIINIFKNKNSIYFSDWLYRNPLGIEKYRNEIHSAFQPNQLIWNKINNEIDRLRDKYKKIVGVHIRKGDYTSDNWEHLYFTDGEVNAILLSYLDKHRFSEKEVCFVICSDGPIDKSQFTGLSIYISKGSATEDLFKLSLTDIIIGSNSTFGAFASYYGNIPHIIFEKDVDWKYYRDKERYFENKYNTTVGYFPPIESTSK